MQLTLTFTSSRILAILRPTRLPANISVRPGPSFSRQELADYYRARKIGCVVFSVDERMTGRKQVPNEDVLALAKANADVMIAFASVDPTRGADAVASAERLIAAGVRGFKLHPPLQKFRANDRIAYPFYEVVAAAKLPVIFHTGHSGIGTGMPGGGGVRLKYGSPMDMDDVAVDFPDMPIILAHPSFPWQDEAISICLHKPQVYIDLSGWSPKYFSPTLVQYANTLLKHKMLFGSDFPLIKPDRWLGGFRKNRDPRRSAAADPEGECGPAVGIGSFTLLTIRQLPK